MERGTQFILLASYLLVYSPTALRLLPDLPSGEGDHYTSKVPDMLQKVSKAVPEGNGPVPQKEDIGFGKPTLADLYRLCVENSRFDKKMDESFDEMRTMDQHVTSLEHGARQPRLAVEADGYAYTETRERTEGAATAVQSMRGDSCTVQKVQGGPKTNSISFDVKPEPPALPCRDDVVAESGDTAPQSCLPSLEICSSTAAGGFVPTGETSAATETSFNHPTLQFHSTRETDSEASPKETNQRTSTLYASYDSSASQKSNLSAATYCRRVVGTKSRQNRTFDPGGSQGHLHACPFMGTQRALVCGDAACAGAAGKNWSIYFYDR